MRQSHVGTMKFGAEKSSSRGAALIASEKAANADAVQAGYVESKKRGVNVHHQFELGQFCQIAGEVCSRP